MKNWSISSEGVVGCVAIRLDDPLFKEVGYDLEQNLMFLEVHGKYFSLECKELDYKPSFEKKGAPVKYIKVA